MTEQPQQPGRTDSRCPPLNLVWMLTLEDKRKSTRRGSFITKDAIPNRSVVEDNRIVDYLRSQGFTIGLARTLIMNTDVFPARIWLIDNSGSMNSADGHRVVTNASKKISNIACTRWEEVTSTLLWHANFSAMMKAPTAIRLIHAPSLGQAQQVGIASSEHVDVRSEMTRLREVLRPKPCGSGGQLRHLREIINSCLATPLGLLKENSMAIVYVTDRLPVDDDGKEGKEVTEKFVEVLSRLQGFPVWVVIRLSTDEQRVVDFYNEIDEKMSFVSIESLNPTGLIGSHVKLDILDDYVSEAENVNEHNPWLNYAYPLHLCKESAVKFPVFDVLNDRPLQTQELVDFCNLLFDRNQTAWALQPLPNPMTHYADFRTEVLELNRRNGTLYNPIKRRVLPWIDMSQLDRAYGAQASTGCSCDIL
mmetsp:Transcript_16650/g.27598  ORF Transcript_16650/g.27598 Transcript_16650/m.27598 type:complete len:420 (+) Transcript_16650:229-1488(+)|eukprot:CAMPEP_0119007390 /NCGR_PEP_ID=MMETSP1176-20130426/2977_1 /TAXON_ID=265551 /ORGANISM="Synedropsis recta cf, Strain CCMP1620" /LENGTH=419 /DNA_ID=CAMNT_0006959529 /DNA_START=209 /DNA_END=1468 /DNA_ORIENTATION=-